VRWPETSSIAYWRLTPGRPDAGDAMRRFVTAAGAPFQCQLEGPAGRPLLVLAHSLGADLTMWNPQVGALAERFRVLRYDARGHGGSAVTPGPYTLDRLARDVLGLLDTLAIPQVHFCGLSMGGVVGLWLGAHAPARVGKLILANTAACIGTPE